METTVVIKVKNPALLDFLAEQERKKMERHIEFVKNFDRNKFKKVILK